jgi:hypothetical protein
MCNECDSKDLGFVELMFLVMEKCLEGGKFSRI